jgi:TolB-like protein
MTIIAVLVLIGAVFFTASLPSEHAAEGTPVGTVPSSKSDEDGTATAGTRSSVPVPTRLPSMPNSVAVLPLENLSGSAESALYANAMHAEIIGQLTKLHNLTVINRDSVIVYAANRPPMRQIASDLRVKSLLTGRFQYAAGRIRVSVDLVDPASGANLWTETYEREFAQTFAVQADIAMNVANALQAEFSEEERARIERRPTDSVQAYNLLLQAQSLIGVGDQAARVHKLVDQAIAVDPDYAAAYGQQAGFYVNELINTSVGSARRPEDLEPLIKKYTDKALSLDPDDMSALNARAQLAVLSWHWAEAEDALDRLYGIRRSSVFNSTWFRSWSGREPDALRIAAREVEVNPLAWDAHFTRALVLTYARDYAAAIEESHDGIVLSPALPLQHAWLALVEVARGNVEEAKRELRLTEQLLGENRSVLTVLEIAYGYGRIGDSENARRLFAEINDVTRRGQDIGTGGQAVAHLAVGEYDEALDWLRRGAAKAERHEFDAGFYSLMNLKLNYTNDPVLERPEFVAVRNRLRGD